MKRLRNFRALWRRRQCSLRNYPGPLEGLCASKSSRASRLLTALVCHTLALMHACPTRLAPIAIDLLETRYWTTALHSSNAQNPEAKTNAGAAPQTARRAAISEHATAPGSRAMAPAAPHASRRLQFIGAPLAQHTYKCHKMGRRRARERTNNEKQAGARLRTNTIIRASYDDGDPAAARIRSTGCVVHVHEQA